MPIFGITSNDTLTLNGHVFNDEAFGDVCSVSVPNELVNMKTGKNGNTIIARNATGFNGSAILRLVRGSTDDQYMQSLVPLSSADFPSTTLLSGTFAKRLGDGQGNVVSDIYTLKGGVISKQVDGKENVEGDTEQAVAVYNIKFANVSRNIG